MRSSFMGFDRARKLACAIIFYYVLFEEARNTFAVQLPATCPGLVPISPTAYECTRDCQQTTCEALTAFFTSTYQRSSTMFQSWPRRQGWEALLTQNCSQILAASTLMDPTYCSWPGVTCCTRIWQGMGLCNSTNILFALRLEVNGLVTDINDVIFQHSIAQLHACGLTNLTLPGNALSGSLTNVWGNLTQLVALNLAKNMITGTIPEAFRKLSNLAALHLAGNPMHGTIPEWLGELQSLEWLGLSALAGVDPGGRVGLAGSIPSSLGNLSTLHILELDSNSLTGTLPDNLCHGNIDVLQLRRNRLTGSAMPLLNCTGALWLDISNNAFSGTLPNVTPLPWPGMAALDFSGNAFEGTLPAAIYQLPHLFKLKIHSNRLNGTISGFIATLTTVDEIDLHNNQLTGTIPEGVWFLPRLSVLDLSHNQLQGTLSPAIGMSQSSTAVFVDNNKLTGHLPPQLGLLSSLMSADFRNNSLSCNGGTSNGSEASHCLHDELLPCFIRLTEATFPLPDASNMECPLIDRKPQDEARVACQGFGPAKLGPQVTALVDSELRSQYWEIDPRYYQYHGCKCLRGFHAVWSANNTVLVCKPDATDDLPAWVIPIAVVVCLTGILLLAAVGLLVWLKLTVQLRRKWLRDKELNNNRLKGVPNGGSAAIVVTDVEKYSDLMQQNSMLTTRVMGIHNAILRKAVTTHAGHVIEQEGDSWSVAFHRPVDAVAFCLQVQQALQKTHWPSDLGMLYHGKMVEKSGLSTAAINVCSDGYDAKPMLHPAALSHRSVDFSDNCVEFAAPTEHSQHRVEMGMTQPELLQSSAKRSSGIFGIMQQMTGQVMSRVIDSKDSSKPSAAPGSVADMDESSACGSAVPRLGSEASTIKPHDHRVSISTGTGILDDKSSVMSVDEADTERVASRSRGKSSVHNAANKHVVRGLRVRMGVASGWVPAGSDIKTAAVFELAKAVSDMANGGQVLMESRTADAVRDWLSDLGCVDHKGFNDKLLSMTQPAVGEANGGTGRRWWFSFMTCVLRGVTIIDRDPVMLNMGQFWVPGLASTMLAVAAAVTAADTHNANHVFPRRRVTGTFLGKRRSSGTDVCADVLLQKGCQASVAATAAAVRFGSNCCQLSGQIELYGIVARSLHARCKVWRDELNMKDNSQPLTKGYFNAPGTLMADLSHSAAVERQILPPVTMVFAAVEDGKALVRKDERRAAVIHSILGQLMQALLLSFPDGYLCREQEAVLKYMVAFREPARAAEWCLLVQEALQYIPWPAEVLELTNGNSPHPSRSTGGATRPGASVLKRPELKMGLAEGVPDSVAPDHLGRADYFGTSVNLAARIMSAAAHSGQVVMSSELAESVFSTWRCDAELQTQMTDDAGLQEQLELHHTSDGAVACPAEATIESASSEHACAVVKLQQPATVGGGDVGYDSTTDGVSAGQQRHLQTCEPATAAAGPRMLAALNKSPTLSKLVIIDSTPGSSTKTIQVSAHHIGTYAFKGCGAMDMVCLTTDAMIGMAELQCGAPAKGAKGTLLMSASGPVLGLQNCPVLVPNILSELRQAWGEGNNTAAVM